MQINGGEALMRSLEHEGVEVVFGLPGGAILPVYDPLIDSPIRHILVRHEQGAGHMAEGYAHVTGKPGVAMVTSGPGATNIVTPLAAGIMGNVLEWYDFGVYGFFASIIATQFFPSDNPSVSLIAAFGAFAAGFLMRPVTKKIATLKQMFAYICLLGMGSVSIRIIEGLLRLTSLDRRHLRLVRLRGGPLLTPLWTRR